MADWRDRLSAALQRAGTEVFHWEAGDGRLMLTAQAARALACSLPGVDGNLFWHHQDLEDASSAGACLAGGGGIGGDRLWIAPEVGFIFTDLRKARRDPMTHSALPKAMDPADWRIVSESPGHLRLVSEMGLVDHRTGKRISLRAHRQFDLTNRPVGLPKRVKHVGFAIHNELTCLEADSEAVAGAWDLLQVPPTGWLVCPTVGTVKRPRSYYDPFGPRHVQCTRDCVRFLIDGHRRTKMGLLAEQVTGRMGFHRKIGKTATLIVRIFAPLPGEPYVDLPRSSSATFGGDALQAYNDDGTFGGFGEMEYHDPALIAPAQPVHHCGACVTHVLAGSDKDIRAAGAALLGVKI